MVRAVAAALAALTLVLAVMKLDGVIDWAWIWVAAPLWATVLALAAGWLVFVVTYAAAIHRRHRAEEAAAKTADRQDDTHQP